MDQDSIALLARWKEGDESAAEEIFRRYLNQLASLAKRRLSAKLQQRVDAEDIVQSAYRSFFRHARSDRYQLTRSGDLWKLLAAITIKKTLGQVEFHQAAKRSVATEVVCSSDEDGPRIPIEAVAKEASIEEALVMAEEIEAIMNLLDPEEQKIFALRLEDMGSAEIANEVECSSRTIRRRLISIRDKLAERFDQVATEF